MPDPQTKTGLETDSNHDFRERFGADYTQAYNNGYYNTKAFDANYAQYLNMIENYKGNPELYQRLLEQYQWQDYVPGVWEGFWGDYSGWNDFYNQLHQGYLQSAQQLIDEYSQREYNSPVQQMQREKAAGINPELNGGQQITPGTAGDATPATEPTPLIPHSDGGMSGGMQLFDFAKDVVTSVVGMYDTIKGLGIKDASQAFNDIVVEEKAYDFALKTESGKIGPRRLFYKNPDGSYNWEKMTEDLVKELPDVTKSRRGNRAQKAIARHRQSLYYDENGVERLSPALQQAILAMDKDISQNAVDYAKNRSEPGYDPEGIVTWAASLGETQTKWRLDTMKFESLCREWEYKLKKAQQPGVAAESRYKADLYGVAGEDGTTLGQAEGQARLAGAQAEKLVKEGEKIRAQYLKWLEDSRKSLYSKVYGNGAWYGKLGTLMLPGVLEGFETVSTRFLDHIDGLLDTVLNPIGKVLGGSAGKAITNALK